MNYKLEKFWNTELNVSISIFKVWTINLKSFEIVLDSKALEIVTGWTINLKSFEIRHEEGYEEFENNEL